jgi:hypothetical protein
MLGEWLYRLNAQYRDEADSSQVYTLTPFGSNRLAFERQPLGIDLPAIAERMPAA